MKRFTSILLALVAVALIAPAAWGTEVCTVKGTVKDENGKPMPNATVQAISKETGRTYPFKTGKNGDYFSRRRLRQLHFLADGWQPHRPHL